MPRGVRVPGPRPPHGAGGPTRTYDPSVSAGGARRIVVTGAAGPAGRALGAQLARRTDVEAVGLDLAPQPVPGYVGVEGAPAASGPDYEQGMLALVERLEPALVLPTVSEELARIAALGLAIGLGDRLVASRAGPAAVAGDKLLTSWALERAGVPVPLHSAFDGDPSAARVLVVGGGRVVLKPRVSRGGRGVHVVEAADDPLWRSVDGRWLVQAFVPGVEYAAQVYRSPGSGRTVVVVLRKTALENGVVGNATAVERAADGEETDVAAVAVGAVEALDLVGPVDVDVRRRADGTPLVLEVNARFGALSAHAPELLAAVLDEWPA